MLWLCLSSRQFSPREPLHLPWQDGVGEHAAVRFQLFFVFKYPSALKFSKRRNGSLLFLTQGFVRSDNLSDLFQQRCPSLNLIINSRGRCRTSRGCWDLLVTALSAGRLRGDAASSLHSCSLGEHTPGISAMPICVARGHCSVVLSCAIVCSLQEGREISFTSIAQKSKSCNLPESQLLFGNRRSCKAMKQPPLLPPRSPCLLLRSLSPCHGVFLASGVML